MKKPTKSALALAVAMSLLGASAHAAQTVKSGEVIVTASRVESKLQDVNMSVSVITAEQIERNAGAKTVADLLEGVVPGVRVDNDGGQGIDRVSIRGEDPFRTLVMIDGQRISEQKSMSGAPILIDPAMIERIEVIRGPASVLYGSDAVGGAINIITKKGGKTPFGASVSAGYNGASDGYRTSASIYGSVNGFNYRVGVAREENEELETPAGTMHNTGSETTSANVFLSYDIDENKTVGLSVDHHDLQFMSGSVGMPGFYVDVPEWKRTRAALFGEWRNVSDTLARVRVDAYQENNDKFMVNHVETSSGPMNVTSDNVADNETDTTGFSLQADWQLGDDHYLVTGYEFGVDRLDAMSSSKTLGVMMGRPIVNSTRTQLYDGEQSRHSVFAAMETTLTDDLTLNYGVRYTHVKGEMESTDNNGGVNDRDSSDGKAVFNVGMSYKATENLTLRGNWSQGYRNPLLQEMYIDTAMGRAGGMTLANPDLKPEESDNFEIGLRFDNGILTADAAVFYSDASNYIAVTPISNDVNQYTNVANAETIGLELDASLKLGKFEPYAVLTLLSREYEENGFTTKKTGTPKLTARYGLRYADEYKSVAYRVNAWAQTQTAVEYGYEDPADNIRYGGATTFNLTAGADFGPKRAYNVEAGLYNITDKLYQNNGSIYEAGRHFAVKLNAKF